ncbi:MAG TPA: hypothetical protein VFG39_01845, partial [Balneolaceae bacterium]|nr:hypothetical protein [Balneolaceae bacterium]
LDYMFPSVEYGSYLKEDKEPEAYGENLRYHMEGQPQRKGPVDPQKETRNYPKAGKSRKKDIP